MLVQPGLAMLSAQVAPAVNSHMGLPRGLGCSSCILTCLRLVEWPVSVVYCSCISSAAGFAAAAELRWAYSLVGQEVCAARRTHQLTASNLGSRMACAGVDGVLAGTHCLLFCKHPNLVCAAHQS